jgi:hypothetical protein
MTMSGVRAEGATAVPMMTEGAQDADGKDAAREAPPSALSRRLTIPVILAAGWGALFAYTLTVLTDDGPVAAPAGHTRLAAADGIDVPEVRLPEPERPAAPAATPPARVLTVAAPAPPLDTVVPQAEPRPVAPLVERAAFVGIWGPNPVACGQRQRRRGFLPATITEDGAKAGRTICRFRNNRREGSAWTMAADCSERGRRWTSQVRLLVEHDRLTWTSGKGQANYIRCGRRSD